MFYMRRSTYQRNSSYPAMDIRCMPSRSRVYIDIEVEDVCYVNLLDPHMSTYCPVHMMRKCNQHRIMGCCRSDNPQLTVTPTIIGTD